MSNLKVVDIRSANAQNLELWRHFMDLPVSLSIELGHTKMTVQALLELKVQGIIQLQRSTGEGVDVLANGNCIARGEIIAIEDRTGVRIKEVLNAADYA